MKQSSPKIKDIRIFWIAVLLPLILILTNNYEEILSSELNYTIELQSENYSKTVLHYEQKRDKGKERFD